MKHFLIFTLLLSFSLLTSFKQISRKEVPTIKWQATVIVVDGNLDDWTLPLRYYDKKSKIGYSMCNDSTTLYLCFRVIDENMQMKILKSGITIALDTVGKKKHHISIKYPLRNSEPFKKGKGKPSVSLLKSNFKMVEHLAIFHGFKTGNGTSSITNDNGVAVKINWDNNNDLIYEVSIPFKSYLRNTITINDLINTMALNVNIDALKNPQNMNKPSGSPKGGGGGHGGGMGGGMSGGGKHSGSMGKSQEMISLFEEQKFRLKFKVALK